MVWSKGCPRCRGDLVKMDDDYEPYLSCLQCGHTVYREDNTTSSKPSDAEQEAGLVATTLRALRERDEKE